MAVSSSKMLQIAWKMVRTGNPKKNPQTKKKNPQTISYPLLFGFYHHPWEPGKPKPLFMVRFDPMAAHEPSSVPLPIIPALEVPFHVANSSSHRTSTTRSCC
jgi:hypothetical protein